MEPVAFPHYFSKLAFKEWAQRVAVALAILDFLDELETVFDDPVHLCDVKPDHFGISESGRVKFLDLDSVFLKPYLGMLTNIDDLKKIKKSFKILIIFQIKP